MMKRSLLVFAAGLLTCCSAVGQRLPAGAIPDHYALSFAIHFQNNTFDGDETIDLTLGQPAKTITLNAVEIEFHEVSVSAGGHTQTAKISTDEKAETATFTVEDQLPAGPAQVHIQYTGQLNDKLRGLYLSTFNGRKYAVTQMEATDARVAFPSFDEPSYKATFDVTAIVDKGDTAISNGKIISDMPGPGPDQHTIKFSQSPKMSSYLVALTVGDWQCTSDEQDGIPLRVCAVPGKEELTHYAMQATKAILHYYNQYYAIEYPYGKLDQIAVPDFQAGAMENVGAIVYRETALLIDDKTASVGAKHGVTSVIAHEMAHQWFGDLVTAKWWDDIWLNEGFASWMAPHPLQAWKPEWMVSQDVVGETIEALSVDGVKNTRPIHQAAETRNEIESLFDGIAYGKTAAVLKMLESYLGEQNFRAGVNLYLKEHQYSNAAAADFWSAMARSSKKPVDKIMPTFVMQAGEPYVAVESQCEGGNTVLNLSQKRYLNTAEGFNESNDQLWQIPVCVKRVTESAAGNKECFLLTERQQQFTLKGCSKFVFPNAGGLGYYRFDYDAAALHQLGDAADKVLTPEERIALMGDEWALMRVGQQTVGDYLTLGNQFKNTPGHVLLTDFIEHLETIDHFLVNDSDRPEFQAWVRRSFSPLLQQIGYTTHPNDTPEDKRKRAALFTALGNIGNDPEVIQQASMLLGQYMQSPDAVDGTLARAVIAVAAKHGDAKRYQEFKAKLKTAGSPEQYYRYFYGLALFEGKDLTQQTLEWTMSPDVRGQDLFLLLNLLENPSSQDMAWDFVRAHFDDLQNKTGGGLGGASIFLHSAQAFCDGQKRRQVEQFFQQHPFPGTERNQKEALESIDGCIGFREQQQPKLASWLKQNGTTNASNPKTSTQSALQ